MAVWWESLSALQQVFAWFAVPATLVLIIQTVLVLFGIGDQGTDAGGLDGGFDGMDGSADGGMDGIGLDIGDSDHGGMHVGSPDGLALLSVRGIVSFFTVGGWAGIVVAGLIASPFLSVVAALVAGFAALYGVALLFKWASMLQSAGNVSLKYAVGKTAEVYITVPAEKQGFGKVLVTFQGRFTECDAVSDAPVALKAGQRVKVVGLADEDTLIVSPMAEEKI